MMVSTVPAPVFAADGGEAAPVAETEAAPTTETTAPTEPEETTTPTEPAETTAPTEPAETTTPTEPAETTVPTEPAETTAPTEPAETTAPTEPAETTAPTEPAETTAPTEPPVEKPDIPAMFAMFAGRSAAEPQAEGDSECQCSINHDPADPHDATCPLYICPDCGTGPWHDTCPYEAHVGKYAMLNEAAEGYFVDDGSFAGNDFMLTIEEFEENTIFRIADWHWNSEFDTIWYRVEIYAGGVVEESAEYWPEEAWIMQGYTNDDEFGNSLTFADCCSHCGKPGCTAEHIQCDKCGEYDCTKLHFWCDRCDTYDCGKFHLICPACGKVDCTEKHVFCGYCNDYDCGKTHGAEPETAPVIPDAPAFTPDEKVSLADAKGNPVSRVTLPAGTKTSLSAWTDLQGTVTYRWQVCYDREKDLWVNIQGQTGKGILMSPAMLLSVAQDNKALIRCVVTDGQQTRTGDAIPVALTAAGGNSSGNSASLQPLAEGDGTENLQKVNVIIEYVFTDGKIAANPRTATLPAGVAYAPADPVIIPNIPGYNPEIGESATDGNAVLNDYQLMLSFTAEEMQSDRTVRVVYKPAPVKVIIRHYQQNVDNDEYTLKESEEKSLTTGTVVGDVHKSYDGFYNLNYEKPTVAADGSTVLEIKYDRKYYLMKFDLGGGYGVDAVYARYDADIHENPKNATRPGYTLSYWTQDGNIVTPAKKMPAKNVTYVAVWEPAGKVNYTVVYWKENADNTNYSYWTQQTFQDTPGAVISGSNSVAPYVTDEQYFTYNDHLTDKNVVIEGDGSTIINVYYNRNYYTIYFRGISGKCVIEEHAHGTNCVSELICGDDGHVHNTGCKRTLNCDLQEHVHNGECVLTCGLPIHNGHTTDCLRCTKELHAEHTLDGGCYVLDCNEVSHNHTTEGCVVDCTHEHSIGCLWGVLCGHEHTDACYTCGKTESTHIHSVTAGCYDLTCTKPIHEEHTEAEGCFKDVVHTRHTDSCYDHESHSHTEDCYIYECGKEPHTHTDSCYRACYKRPHTHNDQCNRNDDENVIYVVTAKYEQIVGDIWPTAANFPNITFSGWGIDGVNNTAVSKRINMTADLCDTSDGLKYANATTGGSKKYLYYMFESFDQTSPENGNDRKKRGNTYYDKSELYYQEVNSGGNWSQKDITGMTKVSGGVDESGSYVFLYYNRARRTLSFHNVSEVVKTQPNIMFEQPLANYKDSSGNLLSAFEPEYPTGSYEPGTREFEGWYTTPECLPGTKVDFTTLTMPNNDLTLYANWVPVSRTVRFFLDKDDMENDVIIPDRMEPLYSATENSKPNSYEKFETKTDVAHGSFLNNVSVPGVSEGYDAHPYKGYTFVGWFYLEDGEEKAFDPANMPVNKDLDLYGKWNSDVLCPYEIRYILDANRNGIQDPDETTAVADSVTGSTLAGNSRTFYAKGDKDLYADYQEGYFPNVASHTIDFKASDEGGVVFTFLYKSNPPVSYTVRYLEKGTNKVLATEVTYPENKKAVVTENFKVISGYMPDAYQKSIPVVPGQTNEIIFYYTADTVHAPVHVVHYIQNVDGDGYTVYQESTDLNTVKGTDYSAGVQTIPGFTFDHATANDAPVTPENNMVTAVVPESGLELKLYYNRKTFSYTVQYLEYGTNTVLFGPVTRTDIRYNKTVTEQAIDIQKDLDGDGVVEDFQLYEPEKNPQSATIVDNNTVITFYYIRCTQTLTVKKTVVGAGTSADPNQKFAFTLQIHSNSGYHQDTYAYTKSGTNEEGWMVPKESDKKILEFTLKAGQTITIEGLPTAEYTVKEVNVPENFIADFDAVTPGSQESLEFTLTKTEQVNVTCVNTSRLGKLTITKTGAEAIDENQSFVFTVTSGDISIPVVLNNKNHFTATLAELPFGDYTITEDASWSWRYSGADAVTVTVDSQNKSVTIDNSRTKIKWLNGAACESNWFTARVNN